MKVKIVSYRPGFNKVRNSILLRDKLEIGLTEAKGITDKIVRHESVEIELDDLDFIEELGNNGVNLYFEYHKAGDIFEGWYDERGFFHQKVKSSFTTEEIEATLSQISSPVLVKLDGSIAIMDAKKDSVLLIDNKHLAECCKQYLIDGGAKVYDSVRQIKG